MRRRVLLTAGAAGAAVTAAGCGTTADGPGTGRLLRSELALPARFRTVLPIPPTARPVRVDATTDHYVLTQRAAEVDLLPGVRTPVWGYDGIFPGPTFGARHPPARRGRTGRVGRQAR